MFTQKSEKCLKNKPKVDIEFSLISKLSFICKNFKYDIFCKIHFLKHQKTAIVHNGETITQYLCTLKTTAKFSLLVLIETILDSE